MTRKLKFVVLSTFLAASGLAWADCLSICEKKYETCVKDKRSNCQIELDNCALKCKDIK